MHQESIDLDSSKSSSPTKKRKIEDKLNDKRPKIRKVEVDFVELDDTNEENEFDMGSDSEFTTSNKKSKLVKNKKKSTEKVTVPTLTLKKLNSNEVHEYEDSISIVSRLIKRKSQKHYLRLPIFILIHQLNI